MKVIRNNIEGNTTINEDTQLHGMVVGLTTVSLNSILQLHGMIIGDLILEESSTVYLHGMVNGNVINNGGYLKVFGTVNGKVIRESGETIIDSNSVIRECVV